MKKLSQYFPQFVYGAFDGIVTTFAVVAASAGAGLSSTVVIVLGLTNLLADGFSMGASAYLSHQSETKPNTSNKRHPKSHSFAKGMATFIAFVIASAVPLIPFFVAFGNGNQADSRTLFITSCLAALFMFILVGLGKAYRRPWRSVLGSIVEVVILGALAAALPYLLGYLLAGAFGQ